MECSVDIYTDYLIGATGQVSATGLAKLYDGAISHDQVRRMLTNEYFDATDLWRKAKPLIRRAEAVLQKDDFAILISVTFSCISGAGSLSNLRRLPLLTPTPKRAPAL
jgi:hypothetical protein